ncbi:NucA/NucB deoxyribonuclease domain-containing protein [Thermoactinomyces sp. DSM 45892]|uniref:NucA/NucB deoxyribonuclease domain-containing protein n=1 Tax=Thermoactinomyces sp. DSM 45892 TaxID=1882753 RepID=UPI0015A365E1
MFLMTGCQIPEKSSHADSVVATIELPADRYPETAKHIKEAVQKGETDICTIDRAGAEKRREESLKGIPTKKGYDRDEFPMALCLQGGKGADIAYISPSDNRGAGSYIGNKLEGFRDGQKVRIVVR